MSAATTDTPVGRVVLAAGGTGGHMFPAQALARELVARGVEVSLITDRRGGGFGPDLPQVEAHHIAAAGVVGGSPLNKMAAASRLALGYLQAHRLLRRLAPTVVVGFGGYASVPTVLAAAHTGRRIVLHEQNQVIGRANRLLARHADAIATSFAQVKGLSPAMSDRVHVTGNPVRPAIAAIGRRPYGLPGPNDQLRLLITGGSQGAQVFNRLLPDSVCRLPEALRHRLRVVQQVRGDDGDEIAARYAGCGVETELRPFFDDMPERLHSAHLLVCRSGASTVAELAAAGRPAILVPYPHAADDHQTGNAQALAAAGAAWLMPQASLSADSLAERLQALLGNPAALARGAACARAAAFDDAARHLADLVCGDLPANGETGRREDAA